MSRMQEQTEQHCNAFVGIDVGKDTLDVFIHPVGTEIRLKNQKSAIQTLIAKLKKHGVELVVLEATSTYHRLVHAMLHEAGLPVSVINPYRSRQFSSSIGRLAKTDGIDAKALALFAERVHPEPTVPPNLASKTLRDLQTARRQVLDEICDLKRQLHTTDQPIAVCQIKERIALGERHKAALEAEIQSIIAHDPALKVKVDILISIPGIGRTSAAILVADLAELGHVNAKEIAALAGVAPMNWDSGIKQGKRMIRGGRKHVRNALYMCAITCTRRPSSFGQTYRHLVGRGKSPKVALTATMRKLVIMANTLVAENRKWEAERPAGNAGRGEQRPRYSRARPGLQTERTA